MIGGSAKQKLISEGRFVAYSKVFHVIYLIVSSLATMFAVEACAIGVASAFVLSFVYVSFLKKMVKTSSEVSRERELSQTSKAMKDYTEKLD